jgi:hypothetical protein
MFKIGTEEKFPEVPDATVWADDKDHAVFYALPDSPRLRMRNGVPQVKLVKYTGDVGEDKGGFVFFDADLALTEEESTKLVELWQARVDAEHARRGGRGSAPQARMGTFTYTRGNVGLLFDDNSAIVSRVKTVGKPSLYGSNVMSCMLELDERQVAILDSCMRGQGTTGVTVLYDLYHWASMPPAEVKVTFHAERFEDYLRVTDVEDSWWFEDHYNDTIEHELNTRQIGKIEVNVAPTPDAESDKKLKDMLRDWGFRMLNEAVAQQAANMLGLIPEEQKDAPQTFRDQLGGDDLDDLRIEIEKQSFSDFEMSYTESGAVEWNLAPNGSLPGVETMKNSEGEFFKWDDFVQEVRPDAFFDELHIYAKVNADFDRLPIHSVQINIEHDGEKLHARPLVGEGDETSLPLIESPDDVLHFADFVDGVEEYTYTYQVNFENESRSFTSAPATIKASDREPLVVNLDDTGVLSLDVVKGDIDFDTVALAEVVVRYEDDGIGPFERRYFLESDTDEAQHFQEVIFSPRNKPFEFDVTKLRLQDGTEIPGAKGQTVGPTLHVDDIFTATRLVRVSGVGGLGDDIERIEVDLTYSEPNGYRVRTAVTLDDRSPSAEWPVRVTALDAGEVSYEGRVFRTSGETKRIEQATAEGDSIIVGEAVELQMDVTVIPDGLFADPSVTKVIFSGSYVDPESGDVKLLPNTIVSRNNGAIEPPSFDWRLELRNDQQRSFQWKAKLIGSSGITDVSGTSDETVLVPELV